MATLSLVSLNMETDKHLGRIIPFLEKIQPDVFNAQELMEKDIPSIEKTLGAKAYFAPVHRHTPDWDLVEGMGIFTRHPVLDFQMHQYAGNTGELGVYDGTNTDTKHDSQKYYLSVVTLEKDGVRFKIGTVHFTWSPDGNPNEYQREDLKSLLDVLAKEDEIVFSGDFNAPRGGEIFNAIAERYTDNIPLHYKTSIDGDLHRAGQLMLMVDGLFSTPNYRLSGVSLECGLSDHCAIIAQVAKP